MLKYHLRTSASSDSSFEVLLSEAGLGIDDFTKVIEPSKSYRNGSFEERIVFFDAPKGIINIAWHTFEKANTYIHIDNVFVKKVENCPEPMCVKITNQGVDRFDVVWDQIGGVSEWEVKIVNYGQDETDVPVKTLTTNTANVSVDGLDSGLVYTVFVRAKCADGAYSDWGTKATGVTKVGLNNNCVGASTIPINIGDGCEAKASGTFWGSTESGILEPMCEQNNQKKKDVWFEFVATTDIKFLNISNLVSISGGTIPTIYGALYDDDCGMISSVAFKCFQFSSVTREILLSNLVVGQRYYLRLGVMSTNPDFIFNLCLSSSDKDVLEVSSSGGKYTVEELVKNVLISSDCDLVSNVRLQAGDGNNAVNPLGYFSAGNNVDFPFKEGIVLSTGDVKSIPGSHTYSGLGDRTRTRIPDWIGDPELNKVIDDIGGKGFGEKKAVAVLEFDFVPIKDSIKFEYLFASQSYHSDCTTYGCKDGGALFAAWLIDEETGEGRNLALVPGTDLPIALSTIRDTKKSGAFCDSRNEEFYWKHYANGIDFPLDAAVNFAGLTVPMSSETIPVVSCRKYKIKLAIADFCSITAHTSAVFFNANSFNLGSLEMGDDLLVETNNAICDGEVAVINSGISDSCSDDFLIEWYKDGELMANQSSVDLIVTDAGEYTVKVKYIDLKCESEGTIKVEVYPKISTKVNQPSPIVICRNSLSDVVLDLKSVEFEMFSKESRDGYLVSYYHTEQDAIESIDEILNVSSYNLGRRPTDRIVYIKLIDTLTGCIEVFRLPIKTEAGVVPMSFNNVAVCASFIFPELEENQYYYLESGATGKEFKAGGSLNVVGEHTVFVLQKDTQDGCYEETSFKVSITEGVKVDVVEDVVENCSVYALGALSKNNKYFTKPGGKGEELLVGSFFPRSGTVYVYASSEDGLCVEESSFNVRYEDCPIQKGISPNGDGLNDYFDLESHGVQSLKIYSRYGVEVYSFDGNYKKEWMGQDNSGNGLPDGVYFYVVISHGKTKTGWVTINR